MRRIFLSLCVSLSAGLLAGQSKVFQGAEADRLIPGAEMVRSSRFSDAPNFVRMRSGHEIPIEKADSWMRRILAMQPQDGFQFHSASEDNLGMKHIRYRQTYHGLKVESASIILHIRNGKVESLNGDFFNGLNLPVSPLVSESSALQSAISNVGASVYKWELAQEEAFIKREQGNQSATFFPKGELVVAPLGGNPNQGKFRLAWKFDVYAHEPLSRQFVFVDAQTGEVMYLLDRIHTADVVGTAVTKYSGTQSMTADSYSGSYRLRESGRGNGIETYNLQRGSSYGTAVDFVDSDNYWNNVNANKDEVATDAHWGAEKTYDYFFQQHNRNSIDGNGYALFSYVHYNTNYNNAFWDGTRMTYGDGDGSTFTPLTAIDVAGHEIGHGLCTFSADLVYSNESGALNESFSDIWGTCIENFGRPTNWNWKIGEDMTPGAAGIRSMSNPKSFSDPDTYMGQYYYTGTADNGGVHTNSGVQNHWFYILTAGESGTNDNNAAYNVTGQGFTKASKIAFRNLTVYLTSNSDYSDARFYSIQSATDLYGPCTPEVIATTNAWYAVGVGAAFSFSVNASFVGSPLTSCSFPATVSFANQSTNGGTYLWDFGDGTTSTSVNPSHTYTAYGNYTVKLIAYGGPCGNDTTTSVNYISVSASNACTVTMNPSGTTSTQTSCTGTAYDDGGPSGAYTDMVNSTLTIAPTGAARVTLTFTQFGFEANYDYLYIYDGPSTASPLIGAYTGTTLPNGGTITSTGGTITLRQSTDQSVTDVGFIANWTCQLPTAAPSVNFRASDTVSCSGVIDFTDLSNNGPTAWSWNFGDGFTSTQQNPQHTYANNGTYTVTLSATNSIGTGTLTKTAYVLVSKPSGPTAIGATRCGPGAVTLSATGSGTLSWYDQASGGTPLGTGTTFTTPSLTNSVVYYVESEIPSASLYVGPVNSSFGTGGMHNNTSVQYQTFTVYSDISLVSVWVNSAASGSRTINLWDASGNLLRDTLIPIASGTGRVYLNWDIGPGSYRIGGSSMNLYRNNTGASYPYILGNKMRITGSSAGAAYYYYFYNWEVKGTPCISQRTAVPVNINPLPTATVTPGPSIQICPGGSEVLTAGGGNSYQWSTGATSGSISVSSAGTYYVIATDGNSCRDTSDVVTVAVVSPVATITPNGPTTFCPGGSVVLDAGPGSNYQWSNGATTQTITVSASGSFSVTMTNPSGCSASSSTPTVVTVTNAPSASITPSGSTTLCPGTTVDLSATTGISYLWSNGETTQTISAGPGTYSVTVTFPGGCQAVSTTTTVTGTTGPTASITPSALSFCTGGTVDLTAGGAGSYLWSTGGTSALETISQGGNYDLTVTDGNGCFDVATVTIIENPLPNASIAISPASTVCQGTPVTLTASGGGSYAWSSGETTPSISPSVSGSFGVTVTDGNNCSASTSATLTINPVPVAAWSVNQTNLQADFTDLSSGTPTSWAWDFGDGNTSSLQNPSHTYSGDGTYQVVLIVSNGFGCSDTLTQTVTVIADGIGWVIGSGRVGVYPNPFSQGFTVEWTSDSGGNVEMELYDLLGHKVATLFQGEIPAGIFKTVWTAPDDLAQGAYMLKVSQNGHRILHRLVKAQ